MKIINVLIFASLVIQLLSSGNADSDVIDSEKSAKRIDKVEAVFQGHACDADVVFKYPDCRDGIKLLEEILQREPGNIRALSLILTGYVNVDREKGMETAKQLLKLDPQNGEAYFYIGRFIGTSDERVANLRKAAQYLPNDRRVHGYLAMVLIRNKIDIPEAVTETKKQIVIDPAYESILGIPEVLWKMGKKHEAKDIYTTYLSGLLLQQGEKCDIFARFGLPKFMNDQDMLNIYKEQCGGFAYFEFAKKEKNTEEKVHLLKKAVELKPNHLQAHGELAIVLLEHEGDVDGAVHEMKRQITQAAGFASRDVVPFGNTRILSRSATA